MAESCLGGGVWFKATADKERRTQYDIQREHRDDASSILRRKLSLNSKYSDAEFGSKNLKTSSAEITERTGQEQRKQCMLVLLLALMLVLLLILVLGCSVSRKIRKSGLLTMLDLMNILKRR
jgi:hypothetical protein